jgi:hypothetical protein
MKLVMATFAIAVLFALGGIAPVAHAQTADQQQQDKQHPAKPPQQHPQEQERPAHQQATHPPQEQRKTTQRPEEQQRQQVHQQQQQQEQRNTQKAQQQQQKTEQKQQRAQQKQQQQEQQRAASHTHSQPSRTQRAQQAPAGGGGQPARGNPQQTAHYEQAHFRRYTPQHGERVVRIPDSQFHEYFGREHRFYISQPVIVGGFPRFQYSGFWFVLEEPWPDYWVYGNYYYVVFTDGNYWLCDYDDPGVQIELVVIA